MKLALIHDWFIHVGGAERVLMAMHRLWPDAPIYTLIADRRALRAHLPDADVRVSKLNAIPGARRMYPALAWAMPSAIEAFDLSAYDTVISSSVLFSKGIIVRPETRHISYCYSPARMLWDRAGAYERRGILSSLFRHTLRAWDSAAAQRPDEMIAISHTVAARIQKYYHRSAIVIPPPVHIQEASHIENFGTENRGSYFLIVARLTPHKMLENAIEAFNKTRQQLIIVGGGPLRRTLRRLAGPTIKMVGWQSEAQLALLYAHALAVVLPNEEDFGLTAVEAMAHGVPVLALRAGGATETVIEGVTGEFFDDPIPGALADGIRRIRAAQSRYDRSFLKTHAQQWSTEHWAQRMRACIS